MNFTGNEISLFMNEVYLLIGGNLGDRLLNLENALSHIKTYCGEIEVKSSIYETAAWGNEAQGAFLNQVLKIRTALDPSELLNTILGVEQEMGRIRSEKYAARTIDIDILYFNHLIVETDQLIIPHPRIKDRRFVLIPLTEIAPEMIDPKTNFSTMEMLKQCSDTLQVTKYPPDVEKKAL